MRSIDLNADLGEGAGDDEALLAVVTSCSVACGGHAGDEGSMRAAVRAARARGVLVGAHPSVPDRAGFGRRPVAIARDALKQSVRDQIEALLTVADAEGVPLRHVKPHGVLYADAARDEGVAEDLAALTADLLPGAALMGPPRGALADAAARAGLRYLPEGFADRAYAPDGMLAPRGTPGAVIEDPAERAARAVRLATAGEGLTAEGVPVPVPARTICLHGDAAGAGAGARQVRDALEAAGVTVRAPA